MTVPPLRKWRWPHFQFYRYKGLGWQFYIDINPDHNPILILSWWARKLDVVLFERHIIRSSR